MGSAGSIGLDNNAPLTAGRSGHEKSDDLLQIWSDILDESNLMSRVTKNDKINSWLLQNLAACPEESMRHRSYLHHGDQLDETEWARLVLKYWLIDEATMGSISRACSTNGAVDSSGICHSTGVHLVENLPLHKREFDTDFASIPSEEPRKRLNVSTTDQS